MSVIGRMSDAIYRCCSRCGKELTDAASRECGVGPICRNKNNDLFARQIPANLNVATALVLSFRADQFHEEISGELEGIKKAYMRRCQRIQRSNDDLAAVQLSGGDFRNVIDWLDKSLSYPCRMDHRKKVINVVEALGYVGLASVLRGDACMSKAKLYVDGNYVYLQGKSNKTGFRAMKSAFRSNVQTPRYRGDSTPYKVSVVHAEKFVELAVRYWPFIEDNTEKVLKQAKKKAKKLPKETRETAAQPDRPAAKFLVDQKQFEVTFPWTGTRNEMMSMIQALKDAAPKQERSYNPVSRAWTFKNKHLPRVKEIIAARYAVTSNR